MSRARPHIGRARLPPIERAKMRPLLEGGIQINAHYEHRLTGNYASSTRSLSSRLRSEDEEDRLDRTFSCSPLATKSCENLLTKRHCWSPQLWCETTRSEEALCDAEMPSPESRRATSRSMGNMTRPSGARAKLLSLLRKLSPRGLRRSSSQPSTSGFEVQSCPWLLVEFSSQDLGDGSCRLSGGSDHSFDLAVDEALKRKEEQSQKTAKEVQRSPSPIPREERKSTSKLSPLRPTLVTPQIFIASPVSSSGALPMTISGSSTPNSKSCSPSQQLSPSKPKLMPKPAMIRG